MSDFIFFGTGGLLSSICLDKLVENKLLPQHVFIQANKHSNFPNLTEIVCQRAYIPYSLIDSVHTEDNILKLKQLNPSFGIVASFGEIFKKSILSLFPIYNVHTGKLPENRGAYPVFWKIKENEDVFSVSIHRVEEKIDAGEVLLIREGDFSNLVFSNDFFTAFYHLAAEALIQTIEKISTSSLLALPVDETKARYYPKFAESDFALNPEEDINLLHKKINRLQFYGNPTILNYALTESSILYNHPIDIKQHILIVISKNSVVLKNSSGILLIKHLK